MKKNKQLDKAINLLIESSFKDGSIIESKVVKSIKILKSMPKFQAIEALSVYLSDLKRLQRQHTLYIETTVPLSLVQLKKIQKIVETKVTSIGKQIMPARLADSSKWAGRQVKITKVITSINPEILGGFKLKIGDEVWDESFVSKINQVKEVINGRHIQSN